jgi:hypothetical protein
MDVLVRVDLKLVKVRQKTLKRRTQNTGLEQETGKNEGGDVIRFKSNFSSLTKLNLGIDFYRTSSFHCWETQNLGKHVIVKEMHVVTR